MENTGVCCDVCECVHNCGCNKCGLAQITITEHCAECDSPVENPHFCKDYQGK